MIYACGSVKTDPYRMSDYPSNASAKHAAIQIGAKRPATIHYSLFTIH